MLGGDNSYGRWSIGFGKWLLFIGFVAFILLIAGVL